MPIELSKVKMADLKKAIKALNASKLLVDPIKMVGKASELAQKFVDGLAECDKTGKLDDVPDEAFSYYKEIVPPKNTTSGTDGKVDGVTTDKAATGNKPTSKITRVSVFAKIVKRGKFTKEQLIEKLNKEYKENIKENKWWVSCYLSLLLELGAAKTDSKGRIVYGE